MTFLYSSVWAALRADTCCDSWVNNQVICINWGRRRMMQSGRSTSLSQAMHHFEPSVIKKQTHTYIAITSAVPVPHWPQKPRGGTTGHQSFLYRRTALFKRNMLAAPPHQTLLWWVLRQQTRGEQHKRAWLLFFSPNSGIWRNPLQLHRETRQRTKYLLVLWGGHPETQEWKWIRK